jgi:acetamidase/formamidase
VHFSGNAYSNIENHEEPGMQSLSNEETLTSLVKRLEVEPAIRAGFKEMFNFLEDSRYYSRIEQAL